MNKTLKALLVVAGITISGVTMAQADDVPNTPKNQAFCGGVLKAVSVGMESYAPGMSRQHDNFARDRIDRASSRGLSDKQINHYFSMGYKQMRKDQDKKDSTEAYELMQLCLKL